MTPTIMAAGAGEAAGHNQMQTAPPVAPTVESIRELIPACVTDVLETMFFCDAEPLSEPTGDDQPVFVVEVDFEGTPSGRFRIRITCAAAITLAADFLGLDRDEVDNAKGLETAFELGNMICGSVVSRVESGSAFELSPPRLLNADDLAAPSLPPYAAFAVDGGTVEVTCSLS